MEEKIVISSDKIENYFLNSLKEGRKDEIKICFMAHNSAWPYYQGLADRFDNVTIDLFGCGTSYLDMSSKEVKDDYDVIILKSNREFVEYEAYRLAQMTQSIAKKKDKKVSFGYCFWIPDEDNIQRSHQEAIVITYEYNKITRTHLIGENKDTLSWFFDIVMDSHDHFEPSKVLNKKNSNSSNSI